MKKSVSLFSTLFLLVPAFLQAQFVSGFESLPVDSSLGYFTGTPGSAGFTDNGVFFRNSFNPAFQSWEGFALSRKTDSVTAGYSNQFSCRPGTVWEGSTFALAYASSRIFIRKAPGESSRRLKRFRLANSTYAARSMQFGDSFAKKFGGASGLDPDFFVLRVFNYLNGSISDSAEFFLADYRAEGSQNDFILTGWQLAETGFTLAYDSVGFELRSSDIGAFGMNTPAYFCMDNLETESISNASDRQESNFSFFPNPASGSLGIRMAYPAEFFISDLTGRRMIQGLGNAGLNAVDVSALAPGLYQLISGNASVRLMIQ